jgi:hypothetical protein
MTSEQAEDAWLRFLLRTGPSVNRVILRSIAEQLAGDAGPAELLDLSADLAAIAEVVAEEARAEAMATPA